MMLLLLLLLLLTETYRDVIIMYTLIDQLHHSASHAASYKLTDSAPRALIACGN